MRHVARDPVGADEGTVTRRPLADAEVAARAVVAMLAPGCARIEVAGSIRRRSPDVKDIEIVAVPSYTRDLLGGVGDDLLNAAVLGSVADGAIRYRDTRTGEAVPYYKVTDRKFYPLIYRAPAFNWPVDLFVVRPPAQWGAILAIRTGPADYSARMVTALHARQMKCDGGRLVSTALATIGLTVDTPTERDFIEACGFPYVAPEERR